MIKTDHISSGAATTGSVRTVSHMELVKKVVAEDCVLPPGYEANSLCAALRFAKNKVVRQRMFHALPHGQTMRWEASKGDPDALFALLKELGFEDSVSTEEVKFVFPSWEKAEETVAETK